MVDETYHLKMNDTVQDRLEGLNNERRKQVIETRSKPVAKTKLQYVSSQ